MVDVVMVRSPKESSGNAVTDRQQYKPGDIIDALADNFDFGDLIGRHPEWVIVKMPQLNIEDIARMLVPELIEVSKEFIDEVTGKPYTVTQAKLAQKRKESLNIAAPKIDAGIKSGNPSIELSADEFAAARIVKSATEIVVVGE